MRRPVHRFAVRIFDPVISEGRVHPSPSLVLKRGISHAQAAFTEATVMILALDHDSDSSFVLPPSLRRVSAHFPAIRVNAHGSVEDHLISQRGFPVGAGSRDGPSSNHAASASLATGVVSLAALAGAGWGGGGSFFYLDVGAADHRALTVSGDMVNVIKFTHRAVGQQGDAATWQVGLAARRD